MTHGRIWLTADGRFVPDGDPSAVSLAAGPADPFPPGFDPATFGATTAEPNAEPQVEVEVQVEHEKPEPKPAAKRTKK